MVENLFHSRTHSVSDKTLHTHTRPAVSVVLAEHVSGYLLPPRQFHTKLGTTGMTILSPSCRQPLLDLLLLTRPGPSWRFPADTAPGDDPGFREVR